MLMLTILLQSVLVAGIDCEYGLASTRLRHIPVSPYTLQH